MSNVIELNPTKDANMSACEQADDDFVAALVEAWKTDDPIKVFHILGEGGLFFIMRQDGDALLELNTLFQIAESKYGEVKEIMSQAMVEREKESVEAQILDFPAGDDTPTIH